jgi:O-antigen/teichoic acid export membrane protein
MNLARRAADGVFWTGLTSVITTAISLFQVLFLARLLDPTDFGYMAFMSVALGLSDAFVRVGFSDAIIAKREVTKQQLSALYWINLFVGGVVYLCIYISSPWVADLVNDDALIVMLKVIGISVPIGAVTMQFDALLRRNLEFKFIGILEITSGVFGAAIAIYLALNQMGVWSLIYSVLAMKILRCLILLVAATSRGWLPKLSADYDYLADYLAFGSYRVGASLMNAITTKVDNLVVGAFLGMEALGYYRVASDVAMKPFVKINPVVSQVTFPLFSRLQNNEDQIKNGFRSSLRLLMFVVSPALLGLGVISPFLIPLLLGERWGPIIPVIQILIFYVLLRSATNLNVSLMLAKQKYKWPLYWNIFQLIVLPLVLVIASIIFASLLSIGWALVSYQLMLFFMAYVLSVRRLVDLPIKEFICDVAGPILTSLIMAICVVSVEHYLYVAELSVRVTLLVVVGVISYGAFSTVLQPGHVREILRVRKIKNQPNTDFDAN